MTYSKTIQFACALLLCGLLLGCATPGPGATDRRYLVAQDADLLERHAPVVVAGQSALAYNQIGHAAARLDEAGEEEIYIDLEHAVFYTRQQPFTALSGRRYHNLIYRFHFPRVPHPHLTAGANGGLFVVVTLNERQQPVLITTVHTCGCYLAFVPTSHLPTSAMPEDWPQDKQSVFGETLPARLDYPPDYASDADTQWRMVLHLRSATHRVMDVRLKRLDHIHAARQTVELQPMQSLQRLPLGDGHTSFFHSSGWLEGYVKDSFKPWELLLMSWWALDLNIGRDKQLGDPAATGTVFYTSLKPWAREASNMYFFADFLEYWGWRL